MIVYGYLRCMIPLIEKYLETHNVYELLVVSESDFLLQQHEVQFILINHLGYKNNSGHWEKEEK